MNIKPASRRLAQIERALGRADHLGVPIAPEKKQRTWLEAPVSPHFPFSKPVSAGLIREDAFENGYREPRTREITRPRPKVLGLLDYHRLR